jgi:hypothetical protein
MPLTIDIADQSNTSASNAGWHENAAMVSGGFAEAAESYRQLGFDAGYARAVADQLEFSVAAAEQVLREQANSMNGRADARRLLYAFIELVDRRLDLLANVAASTRDVHYVEGGLGI